LNQSKLLVSDITHFFKHTKLVLSNQSEKETRYIQYTDSKSDKIPDNYYTTIV
jgi:hypothetical protein